MTDIQVDVDEMASSLLQYTAYDTQEYLSVNQVVKLLINRDVDLGSDNGENSYQDGKSSITVTAVEEEDDSVVGGVSFLSYATVGCILAEKGNWWEILMVLTLLLLLLSFSIVALMCCRRR